MLDTSNLPTNVHILRLLGAHHVVLPLVHVGLEVLRRSDFSVPGEAPSLVHIGLMSHRVRLRMTGAGRIVEAAELQLGDEATLLLGAERCPFGRWQVRSSEEVAHGASRAIMIDGHRCEDLLIILLSVVVARVGIQAARTSVMWTRIVLKQVVLVRRMNCLSLVLLTDLVVPLPGVVGDRGL